MGKTDPKLKRQGSGYLLTITGSTGREARIKIDSKGRMRNLSGTPIIQSDVTAAVLCFRTVGNSGMVENVLNWWNKQ